MLKPILIFVGSGCGGVLRYALGVWILGSYHGAFPWHTIAVNVIGCFAIGLLAGSSAFNELPEEWRLAATVGLLGGFTTFSAFSAETVALARTGQTPVAMLYVAASLAVGLAATWIGIRLASG